MYAKQRQSFSRLIASFCAPFCPGRRRRAAAGRCRCRSRSRWLCTEACVPLLTWSCVRQPRMLCNLNAKTELCPSVCRHVPGGGETANKQTRPFKQCHGLQILPQAEADFVLLDVWLFCEIRCWNALPSIFLGYGGERPYLLAPKGQEPNILLFWINLALKVCLYSCHLCPLSYLFSSAVSGCFSCIFRMTTREGTHLVGKDSLGLCPFDTVMSRAAS